MLTLEKPRWPIAFRRQLKAVGHSQALDTPEVSAEDIFPCHGQAQRLPELHGRGPFAGTSQGCGHGVNLGLSTDIFDANQEQEPAFRSIQTVDHRGGANRPRLARKPPCPDQMVDPSRIQGLMTGPKFSFHVLHARAVSPSTHPA